MAAPASLAQDGGGLTKQDVDQILRELAETKEQVKTLQQEVSTLRAEDGTEWLTEARAKEIRALVSDVLEDADHRASLMDDGATAGWTPEGFFLSSADGDFLLTVAGLMQFRWIFNHHDEEGDDEFRQGFEFARTKLTLAGHVFNRDIEYLVRGDVTRNEPGLVTGLWFLQDAWIRFYLNDDWAITAGQFKVPFNREELVSPGAQLAVERSLLNESLNLGRSQGVQLTWTPADCPDWRVLAMTGDGATDNFDVGVTLIDPGGAPINTPALDEDVEIQFTGRAEYKLAGTWEQFEDFTSPEDDPKGMLLGAALHYQRGEHGGPGGSDPDNWTAATVDFSLECGGANLFVAAIYHQIDTQGFIFDGYGAVIQGGYYFNPKWEVFGRYEWGQMNANVPGDAFHTLNVATVGVNYYMDGHDVKWTTDLGLGFTEVDTAWDSNLAGWRIDSAGTQNQLVLRTQLQLLF
jgi:hypothetical protein